MSEWGQAKAEQPSEVDVSDQMDSGEVALSTQYLVPTIQRIGNRDIETTFLGDNAFGEPTWVLWTAEEPYLIGILRQGQIGYTFEQRTSHGVMLHKDISFRRVQAALTKGS